MIGTIAGTPLADWFGIERGGNRVLDLVARYADLWNCPWVNDPDLIPPIREMVDQACLAADRDPVTLPRTNGLMVNLPGWPDTPGNTTVRAGRVALRAVDGTPEEMAALLTEFARQGVAQIHIQLDPESEAGIAAFAETLALLDRGS